MLAILDSFITTSLQRLVLDTVMSHLYSKVRDQCSAVYESLRLIDLLAIQLTVSQVILGIRWVLVSLLHGPGSESKLQDV